MCDNGINQTNLFVVGAATKGLQVPGVRIGWVVASEANVDVLSALFPTKAIFDSSVKTRYFYNKNRQVAKIQLTNLTFRQKIMLWSY